jgi:predicted MFS family arabinose efflux permease
MTRLPRALIPIYGTTLADTLGYTLMIPLLPTIVRQFHVSDVMVGALLSVPALCSTVAAPIWGKVSDRIGRKPIIIGSQVLTLMGYLVLATAHSFVIIAASRIVSGLGAGGLGAVQSYIADVTEPKQRDLAYSLYGAVFGVAFIIGPLISGFLAREGYAIPFFVASGLAAANIAFTTAFIPSFGKKDHATSVEESVKAASAPGVRLVLIRQFLAILAVVCFLSNFGLFLEHVLHKNVSAIGWLLALAGAVGGAALLFVVTPLAARIGDRRVAQLGLFFSFVAYGLLWFADTLPLFCIVLIFWAVGAAMFEPTLTALLSVRAKASERGAVMGVSDSVNSLAMIVGPAAGAAIIGVNPRLLGVIPAAVSLIAFLLPAWKPEKSQAKRRPKARARAS